ncbi:hypothetical protein [uncultured Bacteroides sp.]|uniref:hypothetical protein n=1 Tax=uncultured Bacteroides sp. TaxID=162156 RepID=UPI0026358FD5|nr:hypothetical protein [uncultured Bacteroides sp.]
MKLTHTLITAMLCLVTALGYAQTKKNRVNYRFATQPEAQMLITDIDHFTNGLNQFDICARLEDPNGRKSQYLSVAMNSAMTWSDQDKARIDKAMKELEVAMRRLQVKVEFPKEVIFVKTKMDEEKGAAAYTRKNWMAFSEQLLSEESDESIKMLVAHELFHILSRNNPAFRKEVYKTIGFTVMDREILFPADLIERRISNPDIILYDNYATFQIEGKEQKCTMIIYTEHPYAGGSMLGYMKVGFVPLNDQLVPIQEDGKTIIYPMNKVDNLYQVVGENTNLTINPEEILAENFAALLLGTKDMPTPELLSKVLSALYKEY